MKVVETEPMSFDMTPMIDCVFQLIIFFMLATDMAQKQLEALMPPKAKVAQKANVKDKRLIVNVIHDFPDCVDWKAMYKLEEQGKIEEVMANPYRCVEESHWLVKVDRVAYTDSKKLISRLKDEADLERETTVVGKIKPSKRVLMIRADFRAPFNRIEWVMRACSAPQVAMWKLEFGAIMPAPEGKASE